MSSQYLRSLAYDTNPQAQLILALPCPRVSSLLPASSPYVTAAPSPAPTPTKAKTMEQEKVERFDFNAPVEFTDEHGIPFWLQPLPYSHSKRGAPDEFRHLHKGTGFQPHLACP